MPMYPRTLHANVLLLDGKIINWKTGTTSWENDMWGCSRQPLHITLKVDSNRLTSQTITGVATNDEENEKFFNETSKDFYKKFKIYEGFSEGMFQPY